MNYLRGLHVLINEIKRKFWFKSLIFEIYWTSTNLIQHQKKNEKMEMEEKRICLKKIIIFCFIECFRFFKILQN